MYNYIYELLQTPVPEDEWTKAWEYHEHPDAFPIADIVEDAKDRSGVIARFGEWLNENRLGEMDSETFTVDAQAADRYFEGRFTAFQPPRPSPGAGADNRPDRDLHPEVRRLCAVGRWDGAYTPGGISAQGPARRPLLHRGCTGLQALRRTIWNTVS